MRRDCAGLRRLYPPRRNAGVAVLDDVARLLGAGNQLGGGCGGQQNPVSALGNGNPSRKRVEAPHIVAVAVFPRIVQRFNVQRLLWRHSRRGKGCAQAFNLPHGGNHRQISRPGASAFVVDDVAVTVGAG